MSSCGDCRQRKTDKMTTQKKITIATAVPAGKTRVSKRRAKAAPPKADPALKAVGANKAATLPAAAPKRNRFSTC